MVCKKCGYQNPRGANFCNSCGKNLTRGNNNFYHSIKIAIKNEGKLTASIVVRLLLLILEAICFYYILVHAIIPFVMKGLIMIAFTTESLQPTIHEFVVFIGNLINATCDMNGCWHTVLGTMINPSVSMTSFARGVFISFSCSFSSAAYIIRLVKSGVRVMSSFSALKRKIDDEIQIRLEGQG